jgi:cell division protein FtsI (penicillin-binding protein 3)
LNERKAENKALSLRILSVGIIFISFYLAVLLRSYQLQILGNAKLNQLVASQYQAKLLIQPKRGAIYDRNGEVLAMDAMVASIGVHPFQVTEKNKVAEILAKQTALPYKTVLAKLNSDKRFLWVERRIPLQNGEAVAELKLPGVQVVHEFRRYYPNKSLAGHVLGAVGYDAKALGGLEMAYDHYLKSESQLSQAERDARGKLFTLRNDADLNNDLYLTIDKNIQYYTEQALVENAKKHNVKNGFAIVMSTKTGEILAMANYPSFNPNSYWSYPQSDWKNHAVIDSFEPGSTFKTVLVASALDSGKIKASDRYFCENGKMRIGTHTIRDSHEHGTLSVEEIMQVSSNIGVTKIAYKIGRSTFYDFIMKMGFGKKTNLGLIGEANGYVRGNYKAWKDIEFSNIAFGQGITVTGLQMAEAYSAIANKGVMMQPIIVKKIMSSVGEVMLENKPSVKKQIMSEDKAKTLDHMLFMVTQEGGTATTANLEGYLAGGKTGTAQKVDPVTHSYGNGQFVSSFIGFAPLKDPEIVVYVVYDTPRQNGYFGGVTAGPVFKEIAKNTLAYLGVAPDPVLARQYKLAQAKTKAEDEETPDEDKVESQEIQTKTKKDLNSLGLALDENRMPDLKGLSLRALLKLSKEHNVKLNIQGNGFVVKQFPNADDQVSHEWKIVLAGQNES